MDRTFTVGKEIILIGYLNIDLSKSNQAWNSLIISYNFEQLINCPASVTKTYSTLIDRISVSCPLNIVEYSVPGSAVSDHYPTCYTWIQIHQK